MLEIEELSKRYGETVALEGASLTFAPGHIHTILGENGSGKSTLVKLLSGVVQPDRGRMTLGGVPFAGKNPADFQALGLATVFQEVLVAPDRTVVDNILLGCDGIFRRRIERASRRDVAAGALSEFAVTQVPLDVPAGRLPLAARQLVVLARALVRRPRVLVLDEVTAALDFSDRESVFALMRRLAGEGCLILFITHRMDEVMSLSDSVSVLRSGRVVASLPREALDPEHLLRLMAPVAAEALH